MTQEEERAIRKMEEQLAVCALHMCKLRQCIDAARDQLAVMGNQLGLARQALATKPTNAPTAPPSAEGDGS